MNAEAVKTDTAQLLAAYETEPHHTLHVARLAGQLFDALRHRHGLGDSDRLLLEVAATLHDIGWSCTQPEGKGHHKASAKMIRSHPWESLAPVEKEIVAEIARYHRKSVPALSHETFAALPERDQKRVCWLAAFLRVADGLDRRHIQRVQQIEVRDMAGSCQIVAHSAWEAEAELAGAMKKADLLESLLESPVLVTHSNASH